VLVGSAPMFSPRTARLFIDRMQALGSTLNKSVVFFQVVSALNVKNKQLIPKAFKYVASKN
jgi:hypothetical protein